MATTGPIGPKTAKAAQQGPGFDAVARALMAPGPQVAVDDLTEEDASSEGEGDGGGDDEQGEVHVAEGSSESVPSWVQLPPDLKLPEGWVIYFMRFRAKWTNVPRKGERQCILWNLTEADEKRAAQRTRSDSMRLVSELAKQMIRAVDGTKADWSAGQLANVQKFWDEVGGRCRHVLQSHYLKTHTLNEEEMADFFEHCVAARTHAG